MLTIHSQSLKGTIKDINQESIVGASVILKNKEEKIINYTYSNDNGIYELKTSQIGQFFLYANAMGHAQKKIEITINENNQIQNFELTPKFEELKEIIIQSTKPIAIKKDTIVINADSFRQGNEQVVEDLLKKIPGLNIDSDGKIKVGNQEVEKVMIEGDDFFEKGYRLLTKNMPANPIDKVEIYQRYSNNKHLKGIEESEKVAINLTLKEDFKRQWFGNMTLGYGLVAENFYELRVNLMNFGKKSKYYFLTNLNNLGIDAVGDINHLVRPFRIDEPSAIGDNQSANQFIGLGFSTPQLSAKRTNFNNAEMLSLNSIFTLTEKVKFKLLGFLNTDENDFFRNSFQSFFINNENFQNTEDFVGRKTLFTAFGKIDLIYDMSKNKTIEFTSKFNQTNENNRSDLDFNQVLLNEKLKQLNQLIDQKIVFTNKFKPNKVLLINGRYINEKKPQNYSVNQFIFEDLFNVDANSTKQFSENKMQYAGLEAHLMNKKSNGDLFEIKFSNELRIDEFNTRFELFNGDNLIDSSALFNNQLTMLVNDLNLSARYRLKLNNFNFLMQSSVHQLYNQIDSFGQKSSQRPFFIVPKIGVELKINEKNKMNMSYSFNTTNAGVLDVYSGFVQTSFRSFSKGLNDFKQLQASNAILNYILGSWSDKFFANAFVMYAKNHDFFSSNSFITPSYNLSERIIIKDQEMLNFSSSVDNYFKAIKSNLKMNLGVTKMNYKNIINNSDLRQVKSFNYNYGFELRSGFSGIFNYHIGTKWQTNEIRTTFNNRFTDNVSFLDLSFVFNEKINFQIKSERYHFGNLDSNNNNYYFLDFDLRYNAKPNKLTFYLTGNNLFNTKTFRNYSISDINISKTEFRLLPRYILLKLEYRF
jgi:hypothetical protein